MNDEFLENLHKIQLQVDEFQKKFNNLKATQINLANLLPQLKNLNNDLIKLCNAALHKNQKIITLGHDAAINQSLQTLIELFKKFNNEEFDETMKLINFSVGESVQEKIADFHLNAYKYAKEEFLKQTKALNNNKINDLIETLNSAEETFMHNSYDYNSAQYDYNDFMQNCYNSIAQFQTENSNLIKNQYSYFRIKLFALVHFLEKYHANTLADFIRNQLEKPTKKVEKAFNNMLNFFNTKQEPEGNELQSDEHQSSRPI